MSRCQSNSARRATIGETRIGTRRQNRRRLALVGHWLTRWRNTLLCGTSGLRTGGINEGRPAMHSCRDKVGVAAATRFFVVIFFPPPQNFSGDRHLDHGEKRNTATDPGKNHDRSGTALRRPTGNGSRMRAALDEGPIAKACSRTGAELERLKSRLKNTRCVARKSGCAGSEAGPGNTRGRVPAAGPSMDVAQESGSSRSSRRIERKYWKVSLGTRESRR